MNEIRGALNTLNDMAYESITTPTVFSPILAVEQSFLTPSGAMAGVEFSS